MKIIEVKIDDIKIGERHRKDLGDLESFAQSIEAAELLQPIGITPENELVFGLRRLAACRDVLGWTTIPARVINVASIAHGEFIENTFRKDLAPTELVSLVEAVRGFSHGGDRRSDQARNSGVVSTEEACKRLGWSEDTFYRAKRVRDDGCEELVKAMDTKVVTVHQASELLDEPPEMVSECLKRLPSATAGERRAVKKTMKRINREKRVAEINSLPLSNQIFDDNIRLYHSSFQQLEKTAGLSSNSMELIFTDIPYDDSFLDQLPELAAFAKRVLVEGGLLVSYVGQKHLDKYMAEFGKYLKWGWQAGVTWGGAGVPHYPRQVVNRFIPLIVFSKGKWRDKGKWVDSHHLDGPPEKSWHDWQKPLDDVRHWLRAFSNPVDMIVDVCAGSFTTALACYHEDRRFVGCDVEERNLAAGQERLRLSKELTTFIKNFDALGSNCGSVLDDWIAQTGFDAKVASEVLRDMPDAELVKNLAIHVEDTYDIDGVVSQKPILKQWASLEKITYDDAVRCYRQLPDVYLRLFDDGPSTAV